jgi:hypothetical protein
MLKLEASLGSMAVAAAAATLLLVLGAGPAAAQVADCIPPQNVPNVEVNSIEDEYPLDEFEDKTCENTARMARKGCNKGVSIAAKCRDLVSDAQIAARNLVCAALTDKTAQKDCYRANKQLLKEQDAMVKDQKKTGQESCTDTVPTTILTNCEDPA